MTEFQNYSISDPQQFRQVLGKFATGVSIITCLDNRQSDPLPIGVTMNSFTSVSLDPPLILFCLAHAAHSYAPFKQADSFMVHILDQSEQDVSNLFATPSADKWTDRKWTMSDKKAPLLSNIGIAHIECTPEQIIPAGDHDIFLCKVTDCKAQADAATPLLYFAGKYGECHQK